MGRRVYNQGTTKDGPARYVNSVTGPDATIRVSGKERSMDSINPTPPREPKPRAKPRPKITILITSRDDAGDIRLEDWDD